MDQGKSEYYEFLDLTDVDDSERFRLNNTLFPHEQAPPGEPPPPPEPRVWHEGPYESTSVSVVNCGSSLTQVEADFAMSGEAMSPHSNASAQGPQGHMGYPPPQQHFAVPPPGQGPHGQMYQMMPPPLSNVYVGNVTANVNVHGYMSHYVPQVPYVPSEHPQEMPRQQHNREYGGRGRRGRGSHKREYPPRPQIPDIVDHQQHQGYHSYIHMPFQPAYYHPGSTSHMAQHATGSPLYLTGHVPMYPHPQMYSPYHGMVYPPLGIPPEYQMVEHEKLEQESNQYPHNTENNEVLETIPLENVTDYQNACSSPVHTMISEPQIDSPVSEDPPSPHKIVVVPVPTVSAVITTLESVVSQNSYVDNASAILQDCVNVNTLETVIPPSVLNINEISVEDNIETQESIISEQIQSVHLNDSVYCESANSVVFSEPLVQQQIPVIISGHSQVLGSPIPIQTIAIVDMEPLKQEPLASSYQKPKGPYVNNKNIVKTVPRKTNMKPLNNVLTSAQTSVTKPQQLHVKPQVQTPQVTSPNLVEVKPTNIQQQSLNLTTAVPISSVWIKNKIYQQPDKSNALPQLAPLLTQVTVHQQPIQQQEQFVSEHSQESVEQKTGRVSPVTSESSTTWGSSQTASSNITPTTPVPSTVTSTVKSWASLFVDPSKKIVDSPVITDPPQPTASIAPVAITRPIAMVSPFDSSPAVPNLAAETEPLLKVGKLDNQQRNQQTNSSSFVDDPNSYRMGEFLSKYNLDNRTISLQPRGLTNRSNYCYINSTLQALVACSPLYNLLKAMPYQTKRGKSTTPITDAMIQLAYEFNPLPSGARLGRREKGQQRRDDCPPDVVCGPTFEPLVIHKMLNGIRPDTFQIEGRQEDAEEFLSCLLNGLNDEMLELMKLVEEPQEKIQITNGDLANGENHTEDGDDWKVMGPKNKGSITRRSYFGRSPISDIFRGQLRSRVQRAGDLTTDNVQPFFTLQLDIERAASVKDALELLVGRDQLEGVTCSRTNQEIEAWQQVSLEELPLVLILHLKWFDYKSDGCSKIVKTVEFPIDLKIDSKIMSSKIKYTTKQRQYKLFAVVYHDGKEASKGHYITDVFHVGYGCWIRYDDSTVKAVNEINVLHPRSPRVPYLLYYRRCDTIGPNPSTPQLVVGRSQH